VGGRLLTTNNPDPNADEALLADLKMRPMAASRANRATSEMAAVD
jgi:hypothetical protein